MEIQYCRGLFLTTLSSDSDLCNGSGGDQKNTEDESAGINVIKMIRTPPVYACTHYMHVSSLLYFLFEQSRMCTSC